GGAVTTHLSRFARANAEFPAEPPHAQTMANVPPSIGRSPTIAELATNVVRVPFGGVVFRTSEGRDVAVLRADEHGGVFEMLGKDGSAAVKLGADPGGGSVVVVDGTNDDPGSGVHVIDESGEKRAWLTVRGGTHGAGQLELINVSTNRGQVLLPVGICVG